MRTVWHMLTPRGRVLLCGGGLLLAVALAIGERDLVRAGTLATILPVLSLLTVLRSPARVTHTRTLDPCRITVGEQARIRIRVTNPAGRGATGALRLVDGVPPGLDARPEFAVGRLAAGETREVSYRVTSATRGRFTLGPVRIAFVDPLGCVTIERGLGTTTQLLVTPATVALPRNAPLDDAAETGTNDAQFTASSGENDTVPREYRHGDDLRRVHWPATARQATLMVRSEEYRWLEHSTLFLDTRAGAHAGTGTESSLELALSVAGSIARRAVLDGQRLRFATEAGTLDVDHRTEAILDALAITRATRAVTGRERTLPQHVASGGTGAVLAILGALRESEVQQLARLPNPRRRHVAVLLRGAAWPDAAAVDSSRAALTAAGWQVLVLRELRELPEAWSGNLATGTRRHGSLPLR